jgi:hypothetical protein
MSDLNSPMHVGTQHTFISDEIVSNFATSRATYNTIQNPQKPDGQRSK